MNGHICLTFDFDAISIWLQREMLTMTPISRGEFGAAAVPRILRMLEERGIRSTWFIPGHTMETYPDLCAAVHEHGHEIGLHGYAHENFNILESGAELAILERTIGIVERITGVRPKGFRSPSWDLSARTVGHLRDLGIVYDSSLMGNDYAPYRCRLGDRLCKEGPVVFGQEPSIVELPVSWSLDDYPYFEYVRLPHAIMHGLGNPAELYANWTADAAYMLRDFEEGVMTVTLHPQVSGRGHRLLALEAWIDSMTREDLDFRRMDEVAELFAAGKRFGVYRPRR